MNKEEVIVQAYKEDAENRVQAFTESVHERIIQIDSGRLTKAQAVEDIIERIDKEYREVTDIADDALPKLQKVERYFVVLGMVKSFIESGILQQADDTPTMQHLLLTYDMPSSLNMCELLIQNQNYTQAQSLLDRVFSIDPQNQEAKNYQSNLHELIGQQSLIGTQQNGTLTKKQTLEPQEKEFDGGRFLVVDSVQLIIQICLLLPYTMFKKFVEGIFMIMYEIVMRPILIRLIQRWSVLSTVTYFLTEIFTKCLKLANSSVKKVSLQNSLIEEDPKLKHIVDKLEEDIQSISKIMKRRIIRKK